ncbi:dihydrolipoyl dehydrogenase family protein [Pacificimonas flava]|uniref:Mercuric ion reductase n=1 Tax=Pacificimonas flava TaxID=1234595 RepID=M2U7A0_9SPHN|nr:FAD-dependent oxidoreductase [Pacificimonas flava]EMD83868.1 Mercuric ion reductase [Pacificimonas flava]MBB5281155.1 pyruvate/2-oxoglutarate dehydrogenase complex dihydrolipoamide dehydrogenase (E3) component [Pacificimonas flava]
MTKPYDIAVIGAGSGGLTVAAGAAQLGLSTVLFEHGAMGGDCLNAGCVPSKALIASASRAHAARSSAAFGIEAEPRVDFAGVMQHVNGVIAEIAPHDSQERFEGLGAEVVRARARLVGGRDIEADGRRYTARRIVLATGSRPYIPQLPGLDTVPYLTNETLWDLRELPSHLLILGGGAIGVEMAQAFRRLGSQVTIAEQARLLPNDDSDLTAVIRDALTREGVAIHEGSEARTVAVQPGGTIALTLTDGKVLEGSHLLVAAGRAPNVEGLGLEAAGIEAAASGIPVDSRLRTANRRIFAVGDCRQGPRFTHAAGYDGGIVIRNAVFRVPAKADYSALPWCTYTDPELAQVGMTEARARAGRADVETVTVPFSGNDRARAERRTEGFIKLVLSKGKLVGCGIVGADAGELIHSWALALSKGLSARDLTGYIAPYPTLGEISKAGAGALFKERLFSPPVRRLVRALSKLP